MFALTEDETLRHETTPPINPSAREGRKTKTMLNAHNDNAAHARGNTAINPDTDELTASLAEEICAVINAKSALYNRRENAAVVPEALVAVLSITLATGYAAAGHDALIRLTAQRLDEQTRKARAVHAMQRDVPNLADTLAKALEANPAEARAFAEAVMRGDNATADRIFKEIAPEASKGLDGLLVAIGVVPATGQDNSAAQ